MDEMPGQKRLPKDLSGFWGSKIPSSVTFACCLLLFLLPFIHIKSRNGNIQKLNGIKLATGFTIVLPDGSANNTIKTGSAPETNVTLLTDQQDPNIHTLVALGLGIMGLFLSIVNSRPDGIGGVLAGTLAAGSLVLLWLNRKEIIFSVVDSNLKSEYELSSLTITVWFYLAVLLYLLAALLSYRRIVLNR